jgi:hypothetical protein
MTRLIRAHQSDRLAKDARKRVENVHYWAKAIDECPVSVSTVFERFRIFLE